jgi:hypothetical protein
MQAFWQRWIGEDKALQNTLEAPSELTFGLDDAGVLRLVSGALTQVPLERALLHLPALRAFWRQELRESHWLSLRALVPPAWFLDAEIIPPGAVIAGLQAADWPQAISQHPLTLHPPHAQPQLATAESLQRGLQQGGWLVTHAKEMTPRLLAHYLCDEKGRVSLRDCQAIP